MAVKFRQLYWIKHALPDHDAFNVNRRPVLFLRDGSVTI